MAQSETPTDLAASAFAALNPTALAEGGKKRVEDIMKTQTEFLHALQEVNQGWSTRAKSEADLASAFVAKLAAARSIPDAITASQEWVSRRMELLAEDGRHVMADSQKLAEFATRFVAGGRNGGSS